MGNDRVAKPLWQNPEGVRVGINRHGVRKYQEVETWGGGQGVVEIEIEQKGLG